MIPRLFSPKRTDMSKRLENINFYSIPENELYEMVVGHYRNLSFVIWDENQTLRLWTGRIRMREYLYGTSLISSTGDHEYLAYGPTKGRGHRSVSRADLKATGLFHLIPELDGPTKGLFGHEICNSVFQNPTVDIEMRQILVVKIISKMFDHLAAPVAIVLTCLRPRIWQNWLEGPRNSGVFDSRLYLCQLAQELSITHMPEGLVAEAWLQIGSVETHGFPDVSQWIGLMAMIADMLLHSQEPPQDRIEVRQSGTEPNESERQIPATPKGTKRGRALSDNGDSIAKRVSMRLRPRDT
jgi:hypothetical protein